MQIAWQPICSFAGKDRHGVPILMEKPFEEYVPELLASYENVGGLNHSDSHNMPSKGAVGQICEDLLQLLFPGFHDDDSIQHTSLAELTSERLSSVVVRLQEQVRKAVR